MGPRYWLWLSHTLTLGCLHKADTSYVIFLLHLICIVAEIKMFYNQPNNLKVIGKYNVESFTNISSLLTFQSNLEEVRIRGGSAHDTDDTWHDVMTPRNTSRDTWHSRDGMTLASSWRAWADLNHLSPNMTLIYKLLSICRCNIGIGCGDVSVDVRYWMCSDGPWLEWLRIRMHCTASLSCSNWGFLVIRKQMGSNFHELSQKLTNIQRTFNISQAEKNLVKSEKYLNVHHTSILGAMDVKVCGCFTAVDKNEILGLNFIQRNVMCEKYFHGGRYWE